MASLPYTFCWLISLLWFYIGIIKEKFRTIGKKAIFNSEKHLNQRIHEAKTNKLSNIGANILTRIKFTYYKVSKN